MLHVGLEPELTITGVDRLNNCANSASGHIIQIVVGGACSIRECQKALFL